MSIYPIACCAVLYKTRQHKAALYVNQTSWHTSRWHQLQSAVTSTMWHQQCFPVHLHLLLFQSYKSGGPDCLVAQHKLVDCTTQVGGLDNTSWWTGHAIRFMIHCALHVRYKTKTSCRKGSFSSCLQNYSQQKIVSPVDILWHRKAMMHLRQENQLKPREDSGKKLLKLWCVHHNVYLILESKYIYFLNKNKKSPGTYTTALVKAKKKMVSPKQQTRAKKPNWH